MSAARTLVGYVPDEFVRQMGNSPATGIELPLEPGSEVIVRIRHSQIEEARVGPSSEGYTTLQLVLKPNASYELYAAVFAADESRAPIFDPEFWQRQLAARNTTFDGPVFRPDPSGRFKAAER